MERAIGIRLLCKIVFGLSLFCGCDVSHQSERSGPGINPNKKEEFRACIGELRAPKAWSNESISRTRPKAPITCAEGYCVGACYHCVGSCCVASDDCSCMPCPITCPNSSSQSAVTLAFLDAPSTSATFRVNDWGNCPTCDSGGSGAALRSSARYFYGDDGNVYGPNEGAATVTATGVRLSTMYDSDVWNTAEPIDFVDETGTQRTMYKNYQDDESTASDANNVCIIEDSDC